MVGAGRPSSCASGGWHEARWLLAALARRCCWPACARPLPAGVTELTYATPYRPTHPFSRADQRWMDHRRAARRAARCEIVPIWSGALLSSDMSMEELRHGVADIGLITPIYARGGAHLIRIQSGFYSGARHDRVAGRALPLPRSRGPAARARARRAARAGGAGRPLPGIVTSERPVRTLADLKGLRMRAPTELLAVLRELGADPVNMPMGEVYSAMAQGRDRRRGRARSTRSRRCISPKSAHYYATLVGAARRLSLARDGRCRLAAAEPRAAGPAASGRAASGRRHCATRSRRARRIGEAAARKAERADQPVRPGRAGALRRALPGRCAGQCPRLGAAGHRRAGRLPQGPRQRQSRTARSNVEAQRESAPDRHPGGRFQPRDGRARSRRTCCG